MSEAEAPYEMVNLVPRMTGLPMTVWASPRGQARHDVRIKVNPTHGRLMIIRDAVSVARWQNGSGAEIGLGFPPLLAPFAQRDRGQPL